MRVERIGINGKGETALGRYLTKLSPEANESSWGVGRELTRSDRKRGKLIGDRWSRSPFEVFYDVADTGCIDELHIWHEWGHATRGKRFVIWSKGLRKLLLGEEDDEKSGEEIVADEIGGEDIADLTVVWPHIGRDFRLQVALLEACEAKQLEGVYAVLVAYGVEVPIGVIMPNNDS